MEEAFGRPPKTKSLLINITPLVDVTLLLLIFFMVTATFREMSAMDIEVPTAQSGIVQPVTGCEIAIAADGGLTFNETPVTQDELPHLLREYVSERPDGDVTIRADKRVPYESVANVLDMVRLEGVVHVTLPVTPRSS